MGRQNAHCLQAVMRHPATSHHLTSHTSGLLKATIRAATWAPGSLDNTAINSHSSDNVQHNQHTSLIHSQQQPHSEASRGVQRAKQVRLVDSRQTCSCISAGQPAGRRTGFTSWPCCWEPTPAKKQLPSYHALLPDAKNTVSQSSNLPTGNAASAKEHSRAPADTDSGCQDSRLQAAGQLWLHSVNNTSTTTRLRRHTHHHHQPQRLQQLLSWQRWG